MSEKYGTIIEPKTVNPPIALLPLEEGLTVAYPAFGSATYNSNLERMGEKYSHPKTGETITFREPRTQESIRAARLGFGSQGEIDFKREVFNPSWLQAGRRVGTKQGIFFNTNELDEARLRDSLSRATIHNGVYLLQDGNFLCRTQKYRTRNSNKQRFRKGMFSKSIRTHSRRSCTKSSTNCRNLSKRGGCLGI